MTRAEILAFVAGLAFVAHLASRAAAEMRVREIEKPTRYNFAAEALQAIADEATALAAPIPDLLWSKIDDTTRLAIQTGDRS